MLGQAVEQTWVCHKCQNAAPVINDYLHYLFSQFAMHMSQFFLQPFLNPPHYI